MFRAVGTADYWGGGTPGVASKIKPPGVPARLSAVVAENESGPSFICTSWYHFGTGCPSHESCEP
jgi:hypothetical protein